MAPCCLPSAFVAGADGIALGWSEGRTYLEMPLWADLFIVLGLLIAVRVISATISDRTNREMGPACGSFGAAPLWLLLAFVVGNIPGSGRNQQCHPDRVLPRCRCRALVVGGRLRDRVLPHSEGDRPSAAKPTKLAVMGFWSLGFVWAFAGAADLTYTPAPGWLQTIGVVFSIVLFLPLAMLLTDLVGLMRGRWGQARNRMTIRFIGAGAILLLVMAVINLLAGAAGVESPWSATPLGEPPSNTPRSTEPSPLWLAAFIYDAAGDCSAGCSSLRWREGTTA